MRAVVVAGVHSGAGKTTVAVGIMGALARRGLRVQPFKAGPDYIDPSYHTAVTGRPCRNLDRWLLSREAVAELFHRAARRADVAVVEGVMGLFDGRSGEGEQASTAELAKLLRAPVVLVVDAQAMARTAAAVVLGCRTFDPALRLAGVILNRVAGQAHAEMARVPIEREAGVPVLGWLPRDPDLALPERHLGLIPTVEGRTAQAFYDRAVAAVERGVDVDRLLRLASEAEGPEEAAPCLFPPEPQPVRARVAVAVDRAFSFYYQDSLDLLEAWGAEIAPFSPLADAALPAGSGAVYVGGGFPELYAAELAANGPMKAALREAARRGVPVYGECGGLMYLGTCLTDGEGREHAMAGLAPLRTSMAGARLTLGYRTVRALRDGPVLRAGETAPGHEFHWSRPEGEPTADRAAYALEDRGGAPEGYQRGNVLASYVHLHLGSRPGMAARFVEVAARAGQPP